MWDYLNPPTNPPTSPKHDLQGRIRGSSRALKFFMCSRFSEFHSNLARSGFPAGFLSVSLVLRKCSHKSDDVIVTSCIRTPLHTSLCLFGVRIRQVRLLYLNSPNYSSVLHADQCQHYNTTVVISVWVIKCVCPYTIHMASCHFIILLDLFFCFPNSDHVMFSGEFLSFY